MLGNVAGFLVIGLILISVDAEPAYFDPYPKIDPTLQGK